MRISMNKKEAYLEEAKEIDLKQLGGAEAVELYRKNIISFETLKKALLYGYTVRQLEDTYKKFLTIKYKTYTFDDVITLITQYKINN